MQNRSKSLESANPYNYCENDIILKLRALAGGSSFRLEDFNFILESQKHPNPIVKNYALQNNPLWFKVALAFELSPHHLLHPLLCNSSASLTEDLKMYEKERHMHPRWVTIPQSLSSKVSELMRTIPKKELTESFYPVMVDSNNGIDYCWFVKAVPDPKYPEGEIYLDEFYLQCKMFYGDMELFKAEDESSFTKCQWPIFSKVLIFNVLKGINQ